MGAWDNITGGKKKGSIWDTLKTPKSSNESGRGYSSAPQVKEKASNESGKGYSYADNADPHNWQKIADMARRQAANGNPSNAVGTSSAPVGSMGGSGASAPVVAPSAELPQGIDLNALYDKVIGSSKESGDANLALYDEMRKKVADTYSNSAATLAGIYNSGRTEADASAAGLGVNPMDYYKGWQENQQAIQGNLTSAAADSTSFFDKLKTARGSSITDYLNSLEADRLSSLKDEQAAILAAADAKAKAASGGGGSGGRGGGGSKSSSGSITETATNKETLANPYDTEIYADLLAKNGVDAANAYRNYALQATGDPTTALIAKEYNAMINTPDEKVPLGTPFWKASGWKTAATTAQKNADKKKKASTTSAILNASAAKGSGTFGAPKRNVTVSTVGKKKST